MSRYVFFKWLIVLALFSVCMAGCSNFKTESFKEDLQSAKKKSMSKSDCVCEKSIIKTRTQYGIGSSMLCQCTNDYTCTSEINGKQVVTKHNCGASQKCFTKTNPDNSNLHTVSCDLYQGYGNFSQGCVGFKVGTRNCTQ